jgi:putative two-component system response regulator
MDKKTILVIEDDIPYANMLKVGLDHFNYYTHVAYSITGGLDVLKQNKVDIILSDVNLPGSNGVEITKKIQSLVLDIPVVLLTGMGNLTSVKKALQNGASDYLVKPIKIEELPIVIERNLERKKLESKRLQENTSDILIKSLRALMRALDAKDQYSSGHSQRVVKLAMLMADELKLDGEDRYKLQLSAFLHDIGKIGMPDSILKKADSLEDYELRKAKDHPVVGSKIINEIEELRDVASIVRHHHERFDGTGYPDGLKGDAIPFFSRILAILDAYEALISDRVYRKAITTQKAIAEIKDNSGLQFDPFLVDIFSKVIHNDKNGKYQPNNHEKDLLDLNRETTD